MARRATLAEVIFVSAGIGKGKTTSCLYVLEKAESLSIRAGGVISPRRIVEGKLTGYDGLDCTTGERFPLVALPEAAEGPGWRRVGGLRFVFSREGFSRANAVLGALASDAPELVFVDEVGKLEMMGKGLYPGLKALADGLARMRSVMICSCRLEAVEWAERLMGKRIPRVRWCPGEPEELWRLVRDRLP